MVTTPASSSLTRRNFCRGAAALALTAPLILPARLLGGPDAPSNRIRVGQIGCGRIAQGHDMSAVLASELADIVAVSDVDARRQADAVRFLRNEYAKAGVRAPAIGEHTDYRELLARPDLDAVVISTPDHAHAELALAAVLAGKDVYLQKPMTMTVAEGMLLRDAVAKSGRILQVGSQQRSTVQFRRACELVRSGRVGTLRRVEIGLPIDPTKPDDPEQPVPAGLDYDRWLGPAPFAYYTEQRVHPQNDYSRPGWLRNEAFCLGMITGWGSHHYDILHWALDQEQGGPRWVEARAEFPKNSIWNVHGAYRVELEYPGGVRVTVSDKLPNGLKFIGDDGWIFVSRDAQTTSSDPKTAPTELKPLDASDRRLLDPNGVTVELPRSREHHENWLQCVRSRRAPLAPAAVAHRSGSACIVSWIAMKLGRRLAWDAGAERFVDDPEADALLSRPERAPYGAHRLGRA